MTNFPSYYSDTYGMQNQFPYASHMMGDVPSPIMNSPTPSLPPLYPSMMTPQLNPPSPMPNYNLSQQRYAQGGSVEHTGLSQIAEILRSAGQGGDNILAHINEEEAQELSQRYGGDINPMTGLPQFGFLKKLGKEIGKTGKKIAKGTEKTAKKAVIKPTKKLARSKIGRAVLPIAAGVVGSMIAPGLGMPAMLGGGLGGGLGGALTSKKPLQGALLGGLTGALAGPTLGGGLKGLMTGTGLGAGLQSGFHTTDSELGQLAAALGLGGAASFHGNSGVIGANSRVGTVGGAYESSPSSGGILGGGSNIIDKALLGAALAGTLLGRERQIYPNERQERLSDTARRNILEMQQFPKWDKQYFSRNITPLQRTLRDVNQAYAPGYQGEPLYFDNVNPPTQYYSRGGYVGYVEGGSAGQKDDVDVGLPEDSYVLDANTVAQLGDGNSQAGRQILDQQFGNRASYRAATPPRFIKARISNGEYVIPPHEVTSLGKGSNERGAHLLKQMTLNVRRHKGFTGFPPKAKSLSSYMKSNRGRM